MERGRSPTARRRQVAAMTRRVAEFLRNTPAISRKSYIAPCLVELFEAGKLQLLWGEDEGGGPRGLKMREKRLGQVLAAVR